MKKTGHRLKWGIILLFPVFSFAQNADWKDLQTKIDNAIKTGEPVQVSRNYIIDKPLVIADWNGKNYGTASIKMIGNATMTDNFSRSVIKATFNDAPILSIHKNKGTIISGITFLGPGIEGRDSRYSPAACIAIDPFCYKTPPDGGYPKLKEWYRGSSSVGGSTGVRIENCTVKNMLIGIIVSPNGHTRNAELITFRSIRFGDCKYGLVGCQDQEKMNRIINVTAKENCDALFVWNKYGAGLPGQYTIDSVNISGNVKSLLFRHSAGYFPLYISNAYAESLDSIGTWTSNVGDALVNSIINLDPNSVTDNQLFGWGITIDNCKIQYPNQSRRLMFRCRDCKVINGNLNALNAYYENYKGNSFIALVNNRRVKIKYPGRLGNSIIFVQGGMAYVGSGVVEKVIGDSIVVKVSPSITNGKRYSIAK
jgi:hypothetical protein